VVLVALAGEAPPEAPASRTSQVHMVCLARSFLGPSLSISRVSIESLYVLKHRLVFYSEVFMPQTIDPTANGMIQYDIGDRYTFIANSDDAVMATRDGLVSVPLGSVAKFTMTDFGWAKDEVVEAPQ
jgi:hypothetical protein